MVYHDENDPQYDAVERYHKIEEEKEDDMSGTYHIYVYRNVIRSEFEQKVHIISKAREKDGNRDNSFDLDSCMSLVDSWIDKYVSLAKAKMGGCVRERSYSNVSVYPESNDVIDICIVMGTWWNRNMLGALGKSINEYIVNGLEWEYYNLYFNDRLADSKYQSLELCLEQIKRLVTSYKAGSIRKKQHPFP